MGLFVECIKLLTNSLAALDSIGAELNMQSDLEKGMSLSIFILGPSPECIIG